MNQDVGTIGRNNIDRLLKPRARDAHKGRFGRVLVIAGSTGYSGAAWFAAMAAVRGGAGLTRLGVPRSIWNQVAAAAPDVMCFPLPCDDDGRLNEDAFSWILAEREKADICVCGPGLGQSDDIGKLIGCLGESERPLLLDADGINCMGGHILHCPLIVTPHEGEFARMGGTVTPSRECGARAYVRGHPCVLVLKGQGTLVCAPDGTMLRNETGNPGMAKGGAGDVLAGFIGGLAAGGLSLFDAATAGVYLHGAAGDICAQRVGEYGMTASDILACLPETMLPYNG